LERRCIKFTEAGYERQYVVGEHSGARFRLASEEARELASALYAAAEELDGHELVDGQELEWDAVLGIARKPGMSRVRSDDEAPPEDEDENPIDMDAFVYNKDFVELRRAENCSQTLYVFEGDQVVVTDQLEELFNNKYERGPFAAHANYAIIKHRGWLEPERFDDDGMPVFPSFESDTVLTAGALTNMMNAFVQDLPCSAAWSPQGFAAVEDSGLTWPLIGKTEGKDSAEKFEGFDVDEDGKVNGRYL
jgi:hypothetical protein